MRSTVPFLSLADCLTLGSERETIRKTVFFFLRISSFYPQSKFIYPFERWITFLDTSSHFPKILFVLGFLISFSLISVSWRRKKKIFIFNTLTYAIFISLRCRKPRLNAQIAAQQVAQQYVPPPPPPPPKKDKTPFKSEEYINDSSNDSCDVKSVSNTNSQSVENLHTTATTPTPTSNHVVIKKEKTLSHSKKSAR